MCFMWFGTLRVEVLLDQLKDETGTLMKREFAPSVLRGHDDVK